MSSDGGAAAPSAAPGGAEPHGAAPLLSLENARIECGAFTSEPLDASGGSRFVALVGYTSPLFRLLRGEARLASGAVRLAGLDARSAVRDGAVTVAATSAPPLKWTARRFLVASTRLSPAPAREAERRVDAALERFRLGAASKYALRDVPEGTRRVVSLVAASLSGASIVVAEAPFAEVDVRTYAEVATVLDFIASERPTIVSFPAEPEADRGGALLERADFTVLFASPKT